MHLAQIEMRIGDNFHIWLEVLFNDSITIEIIANTDRILAGASGESVDGTEWRQWQWWR